MSDSHEVGFAEMMCTHLSFRLLSNDIDHNIKNDSWYSPANKSLEEFVQIRIVGKRSHLQLNILISENGTIEFRLYDHNIDAKIPELYRSFMFETAFIDCRIEIIDPEYVLDKMFKVSEFFWSLNNYSLDFDAGWVMDGIRKIIKTSDKVVCGRNGTEYPHFLNEYQAVPWGQNHKFYG